MAKGRSYKNYTLDEKKLDFDEAINIESSNRLTNIIASSGKSIATIESELMAAGTPISYSTLYKYQSTGISTPYGLAVLANYFRTTTDYLLGLSETKSPDIKLQAIEKETGLSEKAIRNLKSINNISDEPVGDDMFASRQQLNSFLQHPKLRTFIYNIHEAKRFFLRTIPTGTTTEDMANVENAAYSLGGKMLKHYETTQYYRQEAINALRDIVYDLVPDKKKEE